MFDFEKLTVYQKSKDYNKAITSFLESKQLNKVTDNQLRRDFFSVMLKSSINVLLSEFTFVGKLR